MYKFQFHKIAGLFGCIGFFLLCMCMKDNKIFNLSDTAAFTGSITGTIFSKRGPLDNVKVSIFPTLKPSATTFTNGEFTIDKLPPEKYYRLAISANNYYDTVTIDSLFVKPFIKTTWPKITLTSKFGSINAYILDKTNTGVKNARVIAEEQDISSTSPQNTTTGKVTLERLEPGTTRIFAFKDEQYGYKTVTAIQDSTLDSIKIVLDKIGSGTIRGRVIDSNKIAIRNARITTSIRGFDTTSSADGTFRIRGIPKEFHLNLTIAAGTNEVRIRNIQIDQNPELDLGDIMITTTPKKDSLYIAPAFFQANLAIDQYVPLVASTKILGSNLKAKYYEWNRTNTLPFKADTITTNPKINFPVLIPGVFSIKVRCFDDVAKKYSNEAVLTITVSQTKGPRLVSPPHLSTVPASTGALFAWNRSIYSSFNLLLDTINPPTLVEPTNPLDTLYLKAPLLTSKTYYWRVIANTTVTSDTSAVWMFKTGVTK